MAEDLRASHLVEPARLQARLADPGLRIVDLRGRVETETAPDGFQKARYLGCRGAYEEGHIPGAIYLDWTSDLIDPSDPVPAQAAPPERLAALLSSAGIGNEHEIVAYDDHPASQFAARFWWLLRLYGHDKCRILNGGWNGWLAANGPVSREIPSYPQARFIPYPEPAWRMTAEEVAGSIGSPGVQIVDARDEGQYSGRIRRGERGGHIPGALHLPRELLTEENGRFRPEGELRAAVEAAGLDPDRRTVAYCNGGVAATALLFTLSMLGWEKLSNYDGSWNEWNLRHELPVEQSREE